MSIACTFSGKYGDILWSLPTAREISLIYNQPVHFYTMPHYGDICELIEAQPYIASAQGLPGWELDNWGCGAQPWQHPPIPVAHQHVYDLTYQSFPQGTLVDFIAHQKGMRLPVPLEPFLSVPAGSVVPHDVVVGAFHVTETWPVGKIEPYDIAFGFSDKYGEVKSHFAQALIKLTQEAIGRPLRCVDVTMMRWLGAAQFIGAARVFVGERSANHVIAHGLGKPVVEYEVDTTRHNRLFSFPYSNAPCYCPSEPETFELFKHLATCIMNDNAIDHPIMRRYVEVVSSLIA